MSMCHVCLEVGESVWFDEKLQHINAANVRIVVSIRTRRSKHWYLGCRKNTEEDWVVVV